VRSWCDNGLRILAGSYLCLIAGLVVWSTLPGAWGWQTRLVIGGSMAPTVQRGDLLVTAPARTVLPGQIVLFSQPGHPGTDVAHRVVRVDDDLIRTRGDANATEDSTPVTLRQLRGQVVMVIPALGRPVFWLRQGRYVPVMATLAVTVICAVVAFRASPGGRPGERRAASPARRGAARHRRDVAVHRVPAGG
jgi:signal peptidase